MSGEKPIPIILLHHQWCPRVSVVTHICRIIQSHSAQLITANIGLFLYNVITLSNRHELKEYYLNILGIFFRHCALSPTIPLPTAIVGVGTSLALALNTVFPTRFSSLVLSGVSSGVGKHIGLTPNFAISSWKYIILVFSLSRATL